MLQPKGCRSHVTFKKKEKGKYVLLVDYSITFRMSSSLCNVDKYLMKLCFSVVMSFKGYIILIC